MVHGGGRVVAKLQHLLPLSLEQIVFQPRFKDRADTLTQQTQFLCVLLNTDHMMAHVGETGAGHQPHVAAAKYCHSHRFHPKLPFFRWCDETMTAVFQ